MREEIKIARPVTKCNFEVKMHKTRQIRSIFCCFDVAKLHTAARSTLRIQSVTDLSASQLSTLLEVCHLIFLRLVLFLFASAMRMVGQKRK